MKFVCALAHLKLPCADGISNSLKATNLGDPSQREYPEKWESFAVIPFFAVVSFYWSHILCSGRSFAAVASSQL